jgi:hypothetical protein
MPVSVEEAYVTLRSSETQVNAFSYDSCHTSVLLCEAGNNSWHKIKQSSELKGHVLIKFFLFTFLRIVEKGVTTVALWPVRQ